MDTSRRKSKIDKEYGLSNMGQRHVQILLLFLAGFIAYGMRAVLSVGIVAMTSRNPPDSSIPTYPEWHNEGTILSSFFWGYIILQVFAGQISEKYGPKYFFASTFAVASLFTCLIPIMAEKYGSTGVIVNRIVQGLCQGFLYPTTHYVLSKWTPLKERSRIASFVYFAGQLGTAVSMIVTGAISETKFGWPYVFYLHGAIGFTWVAFYCWLGANTPNDHKSISPKERNYIEQTTEIRTDDEVAEKECQKFDEDDVDSFPQVTSKTPWKCIFSSLPFWAILVSHTGNSWGFWTLLTQIPSFMSAVLEFEIQKNSNLSALPYFIYSIFGLIIGPLSDAIITRNILTIGKSRKLFNCIGFLLPALFLIILCFAPKNNTLHVVLLVLAVSTNGGILAGFNLNHIDISPNFAGTLMGITNCIANIASIIAPLTVQFIVTDEKDESLWRVVFFITAGIYVFSAMFFVIFGSGEIQPWNYHINTVTKYNFPSPQDHSGQHQPV